MINDIYEIIQSAIDNWVDSLILIAVAFFYVLSVLQLPVPEIVQMLGVLVVLSLGINSVLSPKSKALRLNH